MNALFDESTHMPSQYGAVGQARVRPLSITAQRAVLLGTALLAALACVLALMLVSANPWLGLRLQADGAAVRVVSVVVGGPAQQAGVTAGWSCSSFVPPGRRNALRKRCCWRTLWI